MGKNHKINAPKIRKGLRQSRQARRQESCPQEEAHRVLRRVHLPCPQASPPRDRHLQRKLSTGRSAPSPSPCTSTVSSSKSTPRPASPQVNVRVELLHQRHLRAYCR